jgi:hypothetical protein
MTGRRPSSREASLGRRTRIKPHLDCVAAHRRRRTVVSQSRFGDDAVWYDGDVVVAGDKMGRTPIDLDDAALDASFHPEQVTDLLGSLDIDSDAGKDSRQSALHGQAKDDGNHPGGCEQASDWNLKCKIDDGRRGCDIDHSRQKVGHDLRLARPVLQHQEQSNRKRFGGGTLRRVIAL